MIEDCDNFTRRNVGRIVLKMSISDIIDKSESNIMHPFLLAHLAYEGLRDSPLKFNRVDSEDINYSEIAISCGQLHADLNDHI